MILFMSDKQICDIMEIQIINIVKPKYNIQHIKKTEKKQKKSNKKPPLSKIMNEVIGTIEKEKIGGVMKDEKDEKLVGYDTVKVACNCAEESKGMRAREVCKHWICPAHGYKHI